MSESGGLPGVESLALKVRKLLWVVLDNIPSDLVEWSLALVRLLHAVDTFPRGENQRITPFRPPTHLHPTTLPLPALLSTPRHPPQPSSLPTILLPLSLPNPRKGGLYSGHYAQQAALRYELCWLPLAARAAAAQEAKRARGGRPFPELVPPLDVAHVWLLHRCVCGCVCRACATVRGTACDRTLHPESQ